MGVVNFKNDPRITYEHRATLREFCSSLGGDPVKLARRLGLKVFKELLPEGDDGALIYDPELGSESGFVIVINELNPTTRQIFTIAHEIGHFVLHRNEPEFVANMKNSSPILKSHLTSNVIKFPVGRRSQTNSMRSDAGLRHNNFSRRLEFEADSFATNLLLPAGLVRKTPEFFNGEAFALADRLGLSGIFVLRRFEEIEFE